MKKLNELFDCNYDISIKSLEDDSRTQKENFLFFCIVGLTVDGHDFIEQAVANGAVAIVASKRIETTVPVIYVEDTNKAMWNTLNKFYDNVLDKVKLIGVTGTEGKTTTTTVIYQILNKLSLNCGLIGSNGVTYGDYFKDYHHTTPNQNQIFESLSEFQKRGCKYAAIEIASERLLTGRLDAMQVDIAVLTNINREHLNSHKTMENYVDCKLKMFKNLKPNSVAIINNDSRYKELFIGSADNNIITCALDSESDLMAKDIVVKQDGLEFTLTGKYGEHKITTPLTARYNVYNILSIIAVCVSCGADITSIIEALKTASPVIGRNHFLDYGQKYKVIIDYAHSPNALKNILEYAREITPAGNKVITVTSSAGGRDIEKRYEMGKFTCDLSNHVIFTTDDARNEDPNKIIDDLLKDVTTTNYERELDRRLAIKKAIEMTNDGDTVLIAGRGNDSHIPIKDKLIPFNDIEVTSELVKEKIANNN